MAEVERRCAAYLKAGADMLFVESPQSMEDIAVIPQRIRALHVFNMSASGKTPQLSIEEVTRLGYKLMLLPNFTALAAIKAMAEVLAEIKQSGSVAGILGRCASFSEFTALGGVAELRRLEARYADEK